MNNLLIDLLEEEERHYDLRIQRRNMRDASDPFTLPEVNFVGIFRLTRNLVRNLMEDILPHMEAGQRTTFIPRNLKIFVALQFFAQGSYQKAVGQDYYIPMSQPSISRCISSVNDALMNLAHIVRFPNTEEKCNAEKVRFMAKPHGFPGIIGAIDCTHVNIIAPPTEDEEYPGIVFLNRKGNYSINVQVVCNADFKILNVNSRFPGSVHDSAIWTSSLVRQELIRMYDANLRNCWLLGDSGYPLEPWLITPIMGGDLTEAQANFNRAQRSLRNIIERFFGIWKGRFRCLGKHRVLHYAPPVAAKIINSCAILHNYCVLRGEVNVEVEDQVEHDDGVEGPDAVRGVGVVYLNQGRNVRNRIVNTFFQ